VDPVERWDRPAGGEACLRRDHENCHTPAEEGQRGKVGKYGSFDYVRKNTYYYHSDHLGSAQLVTDYRGNEYEHIEYTPYGELFLEQVKDGVEKLPFRFTGKELDPETGLYYYGARYLAPKTSLWLSSDPALGEYIPQAPVNDEARKHNQNLPGMGGVFNTVNLHLYHYAGNNPVKYTDPDGNSSQAVGFAFGFVVGGIAGGISAYYQKGNILAGAAGGAVGGGITGVMVASGVPISVASGIGSAAGSVVENMIVGEKNLGEIAVDAVGDGVLGAVTGKVGQGLSSAAGDKIALLGSKAVKQSTNKAIVIIGNGIVETAKSSVVDVAQDKVNVDQIGKKILAEKSSNNCSDASTKVKPRTGAIE